MTTYQIENTASGHIFGTYQGDTPEAAIQAMLDDASHDGPADAEIVATPIYRITVAMDSEEADEFVSWLQEQGHEARIGNDTMNYVNGVPTSDGDTGANDVMRQLWDGYCNS